MQGRIDTSAVEKVIETMWFLFVCLFQNTDFIKIITGDNGYEKILTFFWDVLLYLILKCPIIFYVCHCSGSYTGAPPDML